MEEAADEPAALADVAHEAVQRVERLPERPRELGAALRLGRDLAQEPLALFRPAEDGLERLRDRDDVVHEVARSREDLGAAERNDLVVRLEVGLVGRAGRHLEVLVAEEADRLDLGAAVRLDEVLVLALDVEEDREVLPRGARHLDVADGADDDSREPDLVSLQEALRVRKAREVGRSLHEEPLRAADEEQRPRKEDEGREEDDPDARLRADVGSHHGEDRSVRIMPKSSRRRGIP